MGYDLSPQERRQVAEGIRHKYRKVACSPQGWFSFPTGRAGLEGLGYDPCLLVVLPDQVADSYCGVGNPFALGRALPGQAVLDIGCGAGVDTILAGMMAGPQGGAAGLEPTPEMLARAEANRRAVGLGNVYFMAGQAEDLPWAEASFGLVISNGAFNLVLDKVRALAEAFRVLKPGGRLQVADQVLRGQPPASQDEAVASWFG